MPMLHCVRKGRGVYIKNMQTQVAIIGAGITGIGLARDLQMRGIKCVIADKGDFNSGASGGNHGLLHSGARYVSNDTSSARECSQESAILKKMAPHCIDDTGGLFVAVKGDNEEYIERFPELCSECGIEAQELSAGKSRELEPAISPETIAAFQVEDASIDPFQISLDNLSQAIDLGATFLPRTEVTKFEILNGKIDKIHLQDSLNREKITIDPEIVVNAAGAWSKNVAGLAGIDFNMLHSKGTLVITSHRISHQVINRLRPPSDGDILVPGGNVSILGTTSVRLPDLDNISPGIQEVDKIVDQGAQMIPVLETSRYIRSYAGVRPIYSPDEKSGGDRSASRGYAILEHGDQGVENLVTLTGGKLTSFRLMAERCADLICTRLDVEADCKTPAEPLPKSGAGKWIEAKSSPREWMKKSGSGDVILCECEMIPKSNFEQVLDTLPPQNRNPDLNAFRMRSRMGKGPCQGTFCSLRVSKYLFAGEKHKDKDKLIKDFLRSRWKGMRPVLWGTQLAQAEIMEGMHCGLFGLELTQD